MADVTNEQTSGSQPAAGDVKNTVSRSVMSSLVAKGLYLVSRFFLPPLILAKVSLAEYGLWSTCFILIGYLGMGAFGVSHVYVRYVAVYAARHDYAAINRLVSTGVTLVLALNVLLLTGLWLLLPMVLRALHVAPEMQALGSELIFVTTAIFLLDLAFGVYASTLEGLQRVPTTQATWVASFVVEAVLMVALLLAGYGIRALLWAFVARYALSLVLNRHACRRALPSLEIRPRHFDRTLLPLFYGYGGIVQLSGFLGIFLRSIEKVLAGTLIGVSATALYDIGEKMPMMAAWIPTGMAAGFFPAATRLRAEARHDELGKMYLKGCRYMSIMTGLMVGFMAPFAGAIIVAWLGAGDKYLVAAAILTWFTLPYHMNVITAPGSILFKAIGEPARELVYPVLQLVLVATTVTIGWYVAGATITMINATVASSMVVSSLVYLVYVNHRFGIGQGRFAWQVLLPGAVPYLLAWLLAQATAPWLGVPVDRSSALELLAVNGAIYAAVVPLLVYGTLFDWGEREFLRRQVAHTATSFVPRRWRTA